MSPLAIKELVTDANFDCSDEGIVSRFISHFLSGHNSIGRTRSLTRVGTDRNFKLWIILMSLSFRYVSTRLDSRTVIDAIEICTRLSLSYLVSRHHRRDGDTVQRIADCTEDGELIVVHDRSLGMNLQSLQKIIKCAGNEDTVTLRADESADILGLMFENKSTSSLSSFPPRFFVSFSRWEENDMN